MENRYSYPFVLSTEDGILGLGAALLWTGQGRLVLDYAAVADEQEEDFIVESRDEDTIATEATTTTKSKSSDHTGRLMGIFWAVFQCSSLVGGTISFAYYSKEPPSGSVILYLIFLVFILMGTLATQFFLPPVVLCGKMQTHKQQASAGSVVNTAPDQSKGDFVAGEETGLLQQAELEMEGGKKEGDCGPTSTAPEDYSWSNQFRQTLHIFRTKPMVLLATLFFYTGFNQPYQQSTFGNRFFDKRTIGIELIIFHLMEIVGAMYCGHALDKKSNDTHQSDAGLSGTKPSWIALTGRRRSAIQCLCLFILVNSLGNMLAWHEETELFGQPLENDNATAIAAIDITNWHASILPSVAFACWGFADSQIQVYCYWLIGSLYKTGNDHSHAVGFYKCTQSLGFAVGFYLTPLTRLSALTQWTLSTVVFVAGIVLALFQLPPAH